MRGEHRFDLAQLDPVTPHLDLVVAPAEILEHAVSSPTRQVPRAIKPAAGLAAKRVGNKTLGRQPGPAYVAARHAGSADKQFTGHTDGDRLEGRVEYIHARVGDRPADRDRSREWASHAHLVDTAARSTVSVGPYSLTSQVSGAHRRQNSTCSAVNASPPMMNARVRPEASSGASWWLNNWR